MMVSEQTERPGSAAIAPAQIEPSDNFSWLPTIGRWVLNLLLVLASLGTMIGFLGQVWWGFDAATHFRMQYLVVLLFCAVLYLLLKYVRRAVLASLFGLLNFVFIVPFYLGGESAPAANSYRLVMANIEYVNEDVEAVQSFIRSADADILILEEFTPAWEEHLANLKTEYPYFEAVPRTDAWGIALFSRIPYDSLSVDDTGPRGYPTIYARYNLDGSPVTVIGTHPAHPIGEENTEARDVQLATLVEFASQRTEPVLMCGDFNTTFWSVNFMTFLADADLYNAARGFGFPATWPTSFPPVLVPFDHCLVSHEILIHEFETGPDTGSDHYPILIEFSIETTQP